MGEFYKMCIALVSVGVLLGCAAPLRDMQQTQQIRCTDGDGQILYTGPYNEESWNGYHVQVDESTRAFYPKGMCRADVIYRATAEEPSRSSEPAPAVSKSPEPAKEVRRSPEPAPAVSKSPEPVKEVRRSPEPAPAASKSPEPAKEVRRSPLPATVARNSPAPVKALNNSPEPAKALSRVHERAEKLSNPSEERSETAKSLHKLAEAGNMDAQNQLGLLYYDGRGVPQNFKQASVWFRKAAEQGHAGAQVNLGTLYFLGYGVSENNQEALFWFRKAAAQRDALAFAKLGRMYEQGREVPRNLVQAHMWYNLSAAHGEKRAVEIRDALAKQMDPGQVAEAQRLAVEWKPEDKGDFFPTTAGR
jgi:TPR repeat protein